MAPNQGKLYFKANEIGSGLASLLAGRRASCRRPAPADGSHYCTTR